MRLDGIDPIEARRVTRNKVRLEAAQAMTFRQCAEAYIISHESGWRNARHAKQWPATLETYVYPVVGPLPVRAIDVSLVMKVLEPIWTLKPETASRVRGRIESVLDWAAARKFRQGENPARWRGHLEKLLPKKSKVRRVEHHAALPYDELAEFMIDLRQQKGVAARALEFTILTASRAGEVIGARWGELNLAEKLWTIPGGRMKAGREHRVPLSDKAIAIIEEMRSFRQSDFVFPGARKHRPLSRHGQMMLRRMGRGDLTTHGFRSTFRDWVGDRTNFPREVCEAALAHEVENKVEASYRRGDALAKRRLLMEAWAKFCATAPTTGSKVVAIGRARA
jgi:integrase